MKKIVVTVLHFFFVFLLVSPVFAFVPKSERSAKITHKVGPKLEKALKKKGLEYGAPVYIRVFKKSKKLEIWVQKEDRFELFRKYRICRYSGGLGPKEKMGDLQSPEGFYTVTKKQLNPFSRHHLAVNVGYPNKLDRAFDRTGNGIMIHGRCGSHGCFAMTDRRIEKIYTLVEAALQNGQKEIPVHIFPFKMDEKGMRRHQYSPWSYFWENLKEGYDYFEQNKVPPTVEVSGKEYKFKKLTDGKIFPIASNLLK